MNLTHAVGGAAAALAIAVTARPIAAQKTVLHRFSGTEDFASQVTSGRIGDTVTNVTVLVVRGRNAGQAQAFLRYDIVKCHVPTNSCARVESGFGLIPTTDVTGSGNSTLRVLTDTRTEANPGFTRFAGSGGIVDVTWRTAPGGPLIDASFQGVQTSGSLGLFTRSTGRRVTGNGEAEGTVLGIPARLDSFNSVISANVGMVIEILRNE